MSAYERRPFSILSTIYTQHLALRQILSRYLLMNAVDNYYIIGMWLLKSDEPLEVCILLKSWVGKSKIYRKTFLCFLVSILGHASALKRRNQQATEGPHWVARNYPAQCSLWWASSGCLKRDTSSLEIPNGKASSRIEAVVFCQRGTQSMLVLCFWLLHCLPLWVSRDPADYLILLNTFPFCLN